MAHLPGFAQTLCSLIKSGDVDMARTYYEGWCSAIRWDPSEVAAIRGACSTWSLDPAGFGVQPPRDRNRMEYASLRAMFLLDPIGISCDDGKFHLAAMDAARHPTSVEHVWRMEAIRFRMLHPTKPLDCAAIEAAAVDSMAMFARRAS